MCLSVCDSSVIAMSNIIIDTNTYNSPFLLERRPYVMVNDIHHNTEQATCFVFPGCVSIVRS